MNRKLIKALSLAMVVFMLFAMSAVFAVSAAEITNSLGKYPYPYPAQGNRLEYCGWNMKDNTPNSIWYNSSEDSFYNTKTPTAYVDSTGKTHEFGVGMHSAIKYAPSTVYGIEDFAITSFKTTVYLVQYDLADEEGKIDVSNLETGEANGQCIPIVVYLDLGTTVDGKIQWSQPNETTGVLTYFQEKSLVGKGSSVVLEVDKATLQARNVSHIRIGIKTTHGIYETVTEEVDGVQKETQKLVEGENTAMASIYFADLEITQSREVPLLEAPAIPTRPTSSPAQDDAYEVILPPETDEANWWGKPYGAWMAGSNTKYYLSDMTYLVASNTPNQSYAQGQPTTVNGPYGAPNTSMFFGAYIDKNDPGMSHEIENGISLHPKNPTQPVIGRTDSWTIYDISDYTGEGADTFYALVGLVADTNDWGSRLSSAGVNVYIYGDKGDGEGYKLLAQSELVKGYNIGEFNVNVEGVELLLIDVILPETATSHGYSAVGLGNACLFTADEDAEKPDYTGDMPEEEPEDDGEGDVTTTKKPSTTTTPATTDDADDAKGGSTIVVIIVAAAVVVIGGAVAAVVLLKKRKTAANVAETTGEADNSENGESDNNENGGTDGDNA